MTLDLQGLCASTCWIHEFRVSYAHSAEVPHLIGVLVDGQPIGYVSHETLAGFRLVLSGYVAGMSAVRTDERSTDYAARCRRLELLRDDCIRALRQQEYAVAFSQFSIAGRTLADAEARLRAPG